MLTDSQPDFSNVTFGERTKAALAAAKARDVKLGSPNGARALQGKQVGNTAAIAKIKANAGQRAAELRASWTTFRLSEINTLRGLRTSCTAGHQGSRGDTWHPTAVSRLLARLDK